MRVQVLGQSRIERDAAGDVRLARKPRALLAALAMNLDTPVSADTLVDLVWGDRPPPGAHGTLHTYVSELRRALEPGRSPRERATVLLTLDIGYRLRLDRDAVDATWFADEVGACHRVLAPLASQLTTGRRPGWPARDVVAEHLERLETALVAWSGTAYGDLPDHPDVLAARASLHELRLTAEDDRVLALLALGEHATVVAATEQATGRHPLRERTWALHALALTRSNRQADALAALRRIRGVLADELGLDPGQELQDLEGAVLRQDPALRGWLDLDQEIPVSDGSSPSVQAEQAVSPGSRTSDLPRPASLPWETVGREVEAAALDDLLSDAAAGLPSGAVLVGEPGIGKSRLVEWLGREAAGRGFVVAIGRCSQDDGAPPLWPWRGVLGDLPDSPGMPAPGTTGTTVPGGDPATGAFETWEALSRTVRDAARERPVLVVFEDVHWADEATLRALARLVASSESGTRLALVLTRRPWPVPTGALAEVTELLARKHARMLELEGLSAGDAVRLVESVATGPVQQTTARSWHERTGGNPFFLVELARLAATGAEEATGVPTTVVSVVLRRVDQLPETTREVLRLAAALGRQFPLEVLAAVSGRDAEEVDELLEPAREAGVVRDLEHGLLCFDHALTRDAVAGAVTPTRLARLHARIAHSLDTDPVVAAVVRPEERVAELARHWLAAGPTHVGRAWRAAVEAAAQARASYAHLEACDLMLAAVDAHRRDPAGTREERYALLMTRARDAQQAADWPIVLDCITEAVALARAADDPAGVAAAAAEASRHSVWSVHQWQEVFPDLVEDLRWALGKVGDHDSPPRCRLMLALAVELYYDHTAGAERDALVDEGVRMARRLADPELLSWATRAGCIALWVPRHAEWRAQLSEEGLAAAEQLGDETAVAVATACLAGVRLELGDVAAYRALAPRALSIARRRRLTYVLIALGWIDMNLAAMRGDLAAAERAVVELAELRTWVDSPTARSMELTLGINTHAWTDRIQDWVGPFLDLMGEAGTAELGRDALFLALARAGRVDDLRQQARRPLWHEGESWTTPFTAACMAEAAAALADRTEAERARRLLEPRVGRMVVSGFSVALGPVDGYLALAEATLGHTESARQHADHAAALADAWDLPVYAAWLASRRAELGF